jgi:cytochrome c oxidase subunit 1
MSESAVHVHQHAAPTGFIRKYIFSMDHKVIGRQYYYLALFSVFVGLILSWLVRFHLVWPAAHIPLLGKLSPNGAPNGVMTPEYYLSLLTIHGTIMVFFVLTTAPQGAFGNIFLPIQIGAEDMAFPLLNMLSFWTTFLALIPLLLSFFVGDGPPISGWTAYPPLSAVGADAGPGLGTGQTLWAISIFIFSIASLIGSINFIATTLDLRTRGMSLMRMPLTCWAWFITAILSLLSFAVLTTACVVLLLDRVGGTSFFIPGGLVISDKLQPHSGGSPLLWQHLFWFFGHPEVYIAILPSMGIVSHVLSTFARKPILGYRAVVYCLSALGFLSFTVWGHHMFLSGMSPYSAFTFSVPTLAITIPSAIMTLLWIGTVWGGKLRFSTAAMFCLGFISLFISGGLSGFFLAQPTLDVYLHATYFVVGHFHLVMGVASMFGIFAGTYYWYPKMYGRMLDENLGKIHFWVTFVGAYCIFMPMHYLGLAGNVRRYAAFTDNYMTSLIPVHKFITVSALITGAAQLIFLFNFIWSMKHGTVAGNNPWESTSLEWSTTSPPPFNNFGERIPEVHHGPYELGVVGDRDYIMQDDPELQVRG